MDALEITSLLVMLLIVGPAVGNYATSVVYRLPLGQTPFEKHPYCGDCGTMLKPKDLFPIFSWLLLRGKCRYCGVNIRPSYTVIEIACGLLFAVNLWAFGMTESFLLVTALGVFWVTLAGLDYHQARLYPLILTFCFFFAAMQRLMIDGSIYPMVQSGFILLLLFAAAGRTSRHKAAEQTPETTGYRISDIAVMAGLAGIALPLLLACTALALSGLLYLLQRSIWGWKMASAPVGIAVWAVLVYSQLKISL